MTEPISYALFVSGRKDELVVSAVDPEEPDPPKVSVPLTTFTSSSALVVAFLRILTELLESDPS